MIRDRDLHPVILSNGVDLTNALLMELKSAGVAMIMVHIDSNQKRPDLPLHASKQQLDELRRSMIARIAGCGIGAGLIATGYRSRINELVDLAELVIQSPHADYLLVTNCTKFSKFAEVQGNLATGLQCTKSYDNPADELEGEELGVLETDAVLREALGLHPMSYVGAQLDPDEPRWMSYVVGTTHHKKDKFRYHCLRSSLTERIAIRLIRRISGRYLFYQRESATRFRLQMFANALTGGRLFSTLKFLAGTWRSSQPLRAKHLVFQSGPTLHATGAINHCFACPDATMRDGELVPLCLTDHFGEGSCHAL
jgi:hypothetical protein